MLTGHAGSGSSGGAPAAKVDEAVVYDIVCNRRRRVALRCLLERGETEFHELVDYVFDDEPDADRKSVYASLRQHHVPRLVEEGFVEFDPGSGVVDPSPAVNSLASLLTFETEARSTDSTGGGPPAQRPSSDPRNEPTAEPPDTAPDLWIHRYAGICAVTWSVALVDGLNLVDHPFITAGEWGVVFLLISSVFAGMTLYGRRQAAGDASPSRA